MSCGPTETFFGNKVAETVGGLYKIGPDAGAEAVAMRQLPVMKGGKRSGDSQNGGKRSGDSQNGGKRSRDSQNGGCGCMGGKPPKKTLRGGYGGCTGQPTMLRALGIMNGGKRTRRGGGGPCPCSLGKLVRGGYKPTAKDRAALRRYRAGKSIGFTMRSSLKAKGLIPRANGTRRVSNKYK